MCSQPLASIASFSYYYNKDRSVQKFTICVIITGISAAMAIARFVKHRKKQQRDIMKLRAAKVSERMANFQLIKSVIGENDEDLEKGEAEILALTFEQLQKKLQARKLTAKKVMEAFMRKSLELAEDLNCVTEFLPNALKKAEQLDNMVLLKGPLHGMPFCINDDIELKGTLPSFSCSINFPSASFTPESAVIVRILESQGAIPFCRASTSIICMSFGGRNPYFGEIHNPINKTLSAGGSSCGTACLVQAGGAPFGVGTDRAGGARLPVHLCGITTLKPSRHRISRRGCVQHCVGSTSIPCIVTKRAKELLILQELLMDKNRQHKFDPKVVPLPWNTQIAFSKQKLRIGYFTQFPAYPPLGDTEKTVEKAKIYLESCGHIVVNCEPPNDLKCQEVWHTLMKVHTYRHILHDSEIENTGTTPTSKTYKTQASPRILWTDETRHVKRSQSEVKSLWRKIMDLMESLPGRKSSRDRAIEVMHTTMNSDCDLWNTASLREQFVDEVLESMNTLGVDVIICPVFSQPATTAENMTKLGLLPAVYTFVWNLLDLPAGVVKVWKEGGSQLSEELHDSIGMPIGIQIVGRPYAEEMVLRVMIELDEIND